MEEISRTKINIKYQKNEKINEIEIKIERNSLQL